MGTVLFPSACVKLGASMTFWASGAILAFSECQPPFQFDIGSAVSNVTFLGEACPYGK